jgi:hypothetical protein
MADLFFRSSNERSQRRNPKVERIARVWRAAQLVPWPGQAGGTQWEVLRAHVHTAIKAAKTQAWEDSRDGRTTSSDRTEYHLSLREAGLEAGVAWSESVRRAQEALAGAGWLILHDNSTPSHAATWELAIPQSVANATPSVASRRLPIQVLHGEREYV